MEKEITLKYFMCKQSQDSVDSISLKYLMCKHEGSPLSDKEVEDLLDEGKDSITLKYLMCRHDAGSGIG